MTGNPQDTTFRMMDSQLSEHTQLSPPSGAVVSASRLVGREQTAFWYVVIIGWLLAVGMVTVYSASMTLRPVPREHVSFQRQVMALVIGVAAGWLTSRLTTQGWIRLIPWLYAALVVLLLLIWLPGLGVRVKGAQRWIRIGSLSLQPSELAKLILPCVLCWRQRHLGYLPRSWREAGYVLWPAVLVIGLVIVQPDLGTAVFLGLTTALALWLMGWPKRWFIVTGLIVVPLTVVLSWLRPYQYRRWLGFWQAWNDWNSAPYQLQQSLITLGSGGWWGIGLGRGWQKLSFLPEANTDFVFAVIGEELGFIGTCGVVVLWCALLLCGMRMLARCHPGSVAFIFGSTLLLEVVLQAWINIGVVTGLVPPKGIPHPLISAGGTSLVVTLMMLGTVHGLAHDDANQLPCVRVATPLGDTSPSTVAAFEQTSAADQSRHDMHVSFSR
ncbi:MAG: cell division protein FtsW [Planctomycetaceae bacterium]|nr:MAG: cell division protein FtsW [Planctomycetaceae bacterium]